MATRAAQITALDVELVEVKAALTDARAAVSVGGGARNVTRQSIDALWADRDRIENKLAALNGTSPRVAAFDMRGNF